MQIYQYFIFHLVFHTVVYQIVNALALVPKNVHVKFQPHTLYIKTQVLFIVYIILDYLQPISNHKCICFIYLCTEFIFHQNSDNSLFVFICFSMIRLWVLVLLFLRFWIYLLFTTILVLFIKRTQL